MPIKTRIEDFTAEALRQGSLEIKKNGLGHLRQAKHIVKRIPEPDSIYPLTTTAREEAGAIGRFSSLPASERDRRLALVEKVGSLFGMQRNFKGIGTKVGSVSAERIMKGLETIEMRALNAGGKERLKKRIGAIENEPRLFIYYLARAHANNHIENHTLAEEGVPAAEKDRLANYREELRWAIAPRAVRLVCALHPDIFRDGSFEDVLDKIVGHMVKNYEHARSQGQPKTLLDLWDDEFAGNHGRSILGRIFKNAEKLVHPGVPVREGTTNEVEREEE